MLTDKVWELLKKSFWVTLTPKGKYSYFAKTVSFVLSELLYDVLEKIKDTGK